MRYLSKPSICVWLVIPVLLFSEPANSADGKPDTGGTQEGKTAKLKLGTADNVFDLGAEAKMLAWEKWHDRVGNVLAKRVNRAAKKTLGTAMVTITIQRDHRVT